MREYRLIETGLLCVLAIVGGVILSLIMAELGANRKSARRRLYGHKRKDKTDADGEKQ